MIYTTFIVRASDGLLLAEYYDDTNDTLQEAKRKIKKFLKNPNIWEESLQVNCLEVENYLL